MPHTSYPAQPSVSLERQVGESAAKLQNDLTPELRDQARREWKGSELMSEEQARRLKVVSQKRNLKNARRSPTPR